VLYEKDDTTLVVNGFHFNLGGDHFIGAITIVLIAEVLIVLINLMLNMCHNTTERNLLLLDTLRDQIKLVEMHWVYEAIVIPSLSFFTLFDCVTCTI